MQTEAHRLEMIAAGKHEEAANMLEEGDEDMLF